MSMCLDYEMSASGGRALTVLGITTPAPLLHTRGACIPHITHEVFEMITKDKHIFQIPLISTYQMIDGLKAQQKGIAHFAGLNDSHTYMTMQDPTMNIPQNHFEKFNMPLWSRMGKKIIDADIYMDIVEAFKPSIYEVLCDAITDSGSSKKRMQKSTDRSKHMFTKCLERHMASENLKNNSLLFGSIVGGYGIEQRLQSLEHLLSQTEHLSGFVLDGLDCNGSNVENIMYDSIKHIVEPITSKLPEEKLRLIHGCWNAVALLDLISVGWDLFDTSLPCVATERGTALTFSFDVDHDDKTVENEYEIDLNENRFIEDFEPLLKNCTCVSCKKYSRAYINHLITTKELLASVLLMSHNLHHYLEFFKTIRRHVASNSLNKLRDYISEQHSAYKAKLDTKDPQSEKIPTKAYSKKHKRL